MKLNKRGDALSAGLIVGGIIIGLLVNAYNTTGLPEPNWNKAPTEDTLANPNNTVYEDASTKHTKVYPKP